MEDFKSREVPVQPEQQDTHGTAASENLQQQDQHAQVLARRFFGIAGNQDKLVQVSDSMDVVPVIANNSDANAEYPGLPKIEGLVPDGMPTYDAHGNITSADFNHGTMHASWSYEYDPVTNNEVKVTAELKTQDGIFVHAESHYDPKTKQLMSVDLSETVDQKTQQIHGEMKYDPATGELESVVFTDSDGNRINAEYDPATKQIKMPDQK